MLTEKQLSNDKLNNIQTTFNLKKQTNNIDLTNIHPDSTDSYQTSSTCSKQVLKPKQLKSLDVIPADDEEDDILQYDPKEINFLASWVVSKKKEHQKSVGQILLTDIDFCLTRKNLNTLCNLILVDDKLRVVIESIGCTMDMLKNDKTLSKTELSSANMKIIIDRVDLAKRLSESDLELAFDIILFLIYYSFENKHAWAKDTDNPQKTAFAINLLANCMLTLLNQVDEKIVKVNRKAAKFLLIELQNFVFTYKEVFFTDLFNDEYPIFLPWIKEVKSIINYI